MPAPKRPLKVLVSALAVLTTASGVIGSGVAAADTGNGNSQGQGQGQQGQGQQGQGQQDQGQQGQGQQGQGQQGQGQQGQGQQGQGSGGFTAIQVLLGSSLHHTFTPTGSTTPMTEALSNPDDITQLNGNIFVGFQNGVGPQGEPSASGNLDSTVVELTTAGTVLGQWDVTGKTDGVTADAQTGFVVATVNEDANSSLYTIDPATGVVTHYQYSPTLAHDGGTDAISVGADGQLLISASAPGTTGTPAPQPTYPAVYSVSLDPNDLAAVTPLFFDESAARVANVGPHLGQTAQLGLTDPDSNENVPWSAPRFGGAFMVTSQGDLEQIYVQDPRGPHQNLSVLSLSQSVDDTAWPLAQPGGRLFATDSTNDAVDLITGPFRADQPVVAATPCGANTAPATCPAPPAYPANYLGTLNPWTGQVRQIDVDGAPLTPQGGLLLLP